MKINTPKYMEEIIKKNPSYKDTPGLITKKISIKNPNSLMEITSEKVLPSLLKENLLSPVETKDIEDSP